MSDVLDRVLTSIRYLRHDPIGPFCTIASQLCCVNDTLTDLDQRIRQKEYELGSIIATQTVALSSADSPLKDMQVKQTKANIDGFISALPDVSALKEDIAELVIKKKNVERLEKLLFEISRFMTEYMKSPHRVYEPDEVSDDELNAIKDEFTRKYGVGLD